MLDTTEKYDVIVSFATYRLRLAKGYTLKFLERLVNQKFNGKFHIVANLWKPDYDTCPEDVKTYFKEHDIEVILSDIDRKTHNKYCHVFQKYRGIPIATFDDDQLYRYDALQLLYDTHKRHPATVIGGFCVIPGGIVNAKTGKKGKPRPPTGTPPAKGIQVWGSGGNLYPPEFTEKITMGLIDNWIKTIPGKAKYDNDKFLFRMAKRLGFNGMVVECGHKKQTWRGYLVEKFLPVSDDETAKTWMNV